MGISANQARLMTLTARQHDLELRAQQISAEKMIKSLNSQKWAMEYSEKLNIFNLQKQQSTQVGYFQEIPTPVTQEWLDEKGYVINYTDGNSSATLPDRLSNINSGHNWYALYQRITTDMSTLTRNDIYLFFTDQPNNDIADFIFATYTQNLGITMDDLRNKDVYSKSCILPYYVSPNEDGTCAGVKFWIPRYSTDPSTAIDIDPALLQQMTGYANRRTPDSINKVRYMDVVVTDRPEPTYEYVPYDGFLDINVVKAEYDAAVSSLTSDEKLLDMELTQINTEHKAVKTEYDSVKGLIGENVDKSFNVFG